MAGDIGIREQLLILPKARSTRALALSRSGSRIMHQYGERVLLAELPPGAEDSPALRSMVMPACATVARAAAEDLTETEQFGVDAFVLRQSPAYAKAKANRNMTGSRGTGPKVSIHSPAWMSVPTSQH